METKFELRGEVVVVKLNGRLDFETTEPFRKTCMERLVREKVVFDLKNLNFVGSLGLKDFVDTMDQMAQKSGPGVRFAAVSSEFRRLFEASGIPVLQIYETQEQAVQSFTSAQLSQ